LVLKYKEVASQPNNLTYRRMKMENGKTKVLIVDDDETITRMLGNFLTELGFNVKVYNDGAESLEYYNDFWEEVDVVILDYTMPGLDGQAVGERMLKINPDVKILVLSGNVFDIPEEFRRRVFAAMNKPISIKTLLLAIRRSFE